LTAYFDYIRIYNKTSDTLDKSVKREQRYVKWFDVESRITKTTNKSVARSHAPSETATDCSDVGLQVNVSTVGLFANKYVALNHE